MMRFTPVFLLMLILAVALGSGCGGASPTPTLTPVSTHTPAPTPPPTNTPIPTDTPGSTSTATPAALNPDEEERTAGWQIVISEVKHAEWLPWGNRQLAADGQWLIIYGEARNPTAREITLMAQDFVLTTPTLSAEIGVHRDATELAALQYGVGDTVAGLAGLAIKAGQSAPLVIAFEVPDVAEHTIIWIVGAGVGIALDAVKQVAMFPTPVPTNTPIPTATLTPRPTGTPKPTHTPEPATATATTAPTPLPDAVVTADRVNVRSGPGTEYDVTGTVVQGDTLRITGRNADGSWLVILGEDGSAGWVLAGLVQVNINLVAVPAVPLPPTPTAESTPTMASPPSAPALVIIAVDKRKEFVTIQNLGDEPVNLRDWTLVSERGNQVWTVPFDFVLQPGATVHIHSRTGQNDESNLYSGFDNNIWRDDLPDPAVLLDPAGREVSRFL